MLQLRRLIFPILFLIILVIFCYFRLKPIYFQTVPYTYDQGRDFLTASQIVLEKKFKLSGPTTGIPGLYHGAWWYYILTFPFIIFKGNPLGFYFFIFLIQLISFFIFVFFVKKYFGNLAALLGGLVVASSPYFISLSLIIGNNVLAPPFLLLFLIVNYYLLSNIKIKNENIIFFVNGLLLGLIAESELAFGLILIPAYILIIAFIKELRNRFKTIGLKAFFVGGLFIPFIPRVIFEFIKNFPQTKTFISHLVKPSFLNPKPYTAILQDRVNLFFNFFIRLFYNDTVLIEFLIASAIVIFWFLFNQEKKQQPKIFFNFLVGLLIILFLSSTFYRDSFWSNYFEGVQYILLFIILMVLHLLSNRKNLIQHLHLALFIVILITVLVGFYSDLNKSPSQPEGLGMQENAIHYILDQEPDHNNYCIKIYTPPLIPYTYNYLFFYNKFAHQIPLPQNKFVNRRCWYIIEISNEESSRFQWRFINIPKGAQMIKRQPMRDLYVELWKI